MSLNVKRYFAPTARDALRRLKEELGPDAIVLSNRSVEDGVEILAVPSDEIGSIMPPSSSRDAGGGVGAILDAFSDSSHITPKRQTSGSQELVSKMDSRMAKSPDKESDPDFTISLSSAVQRSAVKPTPSEQHIQNGKGRSVVSSESSQRVRSSPVKPVVSTDAPRLESTDEKKVLDELRLLKGLIEKQLTGFAWSDLTRTAPAKTLLLTELLDAGFSPGLARQLVDELPEGGATVEARKLVKSTIGRLLLTVDSDADIIDRGGVYALVGPTGVGKTTTTAKLAARCVVRHGADKLALLTTDSYRIGAHEQLRIYGRILGVPVHAVRDASDLHQALVDLSSKHMVLIDTVGMSQRDRLVAEQAAMLMNAGDVRRLLLLNAGARGDTLDDVVRAYSGPDLAGVILSKVDEAVSLAPALDTIIRHELDLYYVANGQRVPEDLHLPNRPYLLHRALKEVSEDSPHRLTGSEAGMMFSSTGSSGATHV